MKQIRFTRGSRRHRIGKAHAYHVMATAPVDVGTDPVTGDTTLAWVGIDQRGREIEVVAVEKPDCFLVIHVMPTHYRKGTS